MPNAGLSYFQNSGPTDVPLDLVEISHPSFSQRYRRVRNARDGITVRLEAGAADVGADRMAFFDWYPMEIVDLSDQADLDFGLRVSFGDLGEVLPAELDRVYAAGTTQVKPQLIYRLYSSDDLTLPILTYRLEISAFGFKMDGATFDATAPYVNINKTGETYNLTRFATLRGWLK